MAEHESGPQEPGEQNDPPADPPEGADPLVWRLAHHLYDEHRAHADNFCVTCREFWPCRSRQFAEEALSQAFASADDGPDGQPPGGNGQRE